MKLDLKKISLPIMQCDDGCGECCGVVMCTEAEFNRVVDYAKRNGVEPIRQGTTCPFFQGGRCTVYAVRPFICRLYGHVSGMSCPRGYNNNVTPARERQVMEAYGEPERFLHEAIPGYSLDELKVEVETYIADGGSAA